jgi:hypothetical protein
MPAGYTLNALEQAMVDVIEEHTTMRKRLEEIEEVRSDSEGRLYWNASGNYLCERLGAVKGVQEDGGGVARSACVVGAGAAPLLRNEGVDGADREDTGGVA